MLLDDTLARRVGLPSHCANSIHKGAGLLVRARSLTFQKVSPQWTPRAPGQNPHSRLQAVNNTSLWSCFCKSYCLECYIKTQIVWHGQAHAGHVMCEQLLARAHVELMQCIAFPTPDSRSRAPAWGPGRCCSGHVSHLASVGFCARREGPVLLRKVGQLLTGSDRRVASSTRTTTAF